MFRKNVLVLGLALIALITSGTGLVPFDVHAASPAQQAEPISIVQAYYDAYNAGDIDRAVSYLSDDVVFVNPTGTYQGKDAARANLEAIKKDGISFELSDLKDENGRVTYAYEVIIGGEAVENGTDGLTIVTDGKITFDGTVETEKQLPTTGAQSPLSGLWLVIAAGLAFIAVGGWLLMRRGSPAPSK